MAESQRAQKALRDLPYSVHSKIIRSMDADKGWEDLACEADFTMSEIMIFKGEQNRSDGSPTRKLILELSNKNYKVHDLHEKLKKANRIYEMQILQDYILNGGPEPKCHDFSSLSSSRSETNSLQSLLSQLDITDPKSSRHMPSSSYNAPASGSEVNFNRHPPMGNGKSVRGGTKLYDDKVIPGTEYSTVSKHFHDGARLPESLHAQVTAIQSNRHHHGYGGSEGSYSTLPTLPSSIGSASSNSNNNASTANCSMAHLAYGGNPESQSRPALVPTTSQSYEDMAIGVKPAFSYNDIQQATGNFDERNCVGCGTFGTVYRGSLRGEECAIKRLNEAPEGHSERSNQIKKELTAFLKYQHKNIVTLYGYAIDGPHVCLVYEFLKHGSLEDRLCQKNNSSPLPWERRLNILVGACRGLNFLHTMHQPPLIHGDIRSANILLDDYLEAKICDLGQSRYAESGGPDKSSPTHITFAETSTKIFGTRVYQAPEIANNSSISVKSDIYSTGVVFLEVCSGLPAYDPNRNESKNLVYLFQNQIVERDESEWVEEFRDRNASPDVPTVLLDLLKLAKKCLSHTKAPRPDSKKLLDAIESLYNDSLHPPAENLPDSRYNSGATSVRPNSEVSTRCPSQLSEMMMSSAVMSQTSSMLPHAGAISPPPKSIQMQDQKLKEFSSHSTSGNAYAGVSASYYGPESRQTPALSPQSQQNYMRSEPQRLQEYYDKNPGQRIDRLSGSEPKCDGKLSHLNAPPEGSNVSSVLAEDYYPAPDPQKMAQLIKYDAHNFGLDHDHQQQTHSDADVFLDHPYSEEKMRYLIELPETTYPTMQQFNAIPPSLLEGLPPGNNGMAYSDYRLISPPRLNNAPGPSSCDSHFAPHQAVSSGHQNKRKEYNLFDKYNKEVGQEPSNEKENT